MDSLPWAPCPTLPLDLDRTPEERCAAIPADAIEQGQTLLRAIMQEIPATAKVFADVVRARTGGRFQAEVAAMARRAHVSWREIMLANISYDLMLAFLGCSTIALGTPEGPVLARNMDWWPEDLLAKASYLLRYESGQRLSFAQAGWPGSVGVVSGLSARGFAVVLNAVIGPERRKWLGYPVLLFLRRVLEEATGFADAVQHLSTQKLAVSALLTVVGRENQERVVIERTPTRSALRWGKQDEPLIATNDYRLLYPPQAQPGVRNYETTCTRYDALDCFFRHHRDDQPVSESSLLYILSDARVKQSITAQHVVMRPRQNEMHLYVPRHLLA